MVSNSTDGNVETAGGGQEMTPAIQEAIEIWRTKDLPIILDPKRPPLVLQSIRETSDLTIETIKTTVAEYYGLSRARMESAQRSREVSIPRQIAMYLARHHTRKSLPQIANAFGGRDHSTACHATVRVEQLLQNDDSVREDVAALKRLLKI
jgi:chromosomal replication initiator protein